MRRRRRGLARGGFAVEPGDEILERRRLFGEFVRALLLRAERVLRRGQRLLASVDERGKAHFVGRKRAALLGKFVALPRNRFPGLGEGVEVAARRFDLRFQFRDEGAHNGSRAHRFRHVVRLDENGGRRIAAHPLQGGKHIRDHAAPALERSARVRRPWR